MLRKDLADFLSAYELNDLAQKARRGEYDIWGSLAGSQNLWIYTPWAGQTWPAKYSGGNGGTLKSTIEIKARHKPNVRSLSGSALISDVHIQLFKRKRRFPGRAGESARATFVIPGASCKRLCPLDPPA